MSLPKIAAVNETKTPVLQSEPPVKRTKHEEAEVNHPCTSESSSKTKIRKHKYALILSYSGLGYFGMQVQLGDNGMPTIESELLRVLHNCGMIEENDIVRPSNFLFQRAARTDKNVSAVQQVCSMKLPETSENCLEELNKQLPKQIKILGIQRTTNGFNCKKWCSARTYSYTIPSYAFSKVDELCDDHFRLSQSRLDEINNVLKCFKGTHNFYNFTSDRPFEEESCNRYVMSIFCEEPFLHEQTGIEFVTVVIKGQSFVKHQIRKIVGLCVAIVRNVASRNVIKEAWKSIRMDIPRAPGTGLVLESICYDVYNKKFGKTHKPFLDSDYAEEKANFRKTQILDNICTTEKSEREVLKWTSDLLLHKFAFRHEQNHSTMGEILEVNKNIDAQNLSDSKGVEVNETKRMREEGQYFPESSEEAQSVLDMPQNEIPASTSERENYLETVLKPDVDDTLVSVVEKRESYPSKIVTHLKTQLDAQYERTAAPVFVSDSEKKPLQEIESALSEHGEKLKKLRSVKSRIDAFEDSRFVQDLNEIEERLKECEDYQRVKHKLIKF